MLREFLRGASRRSAAQRGVFRRGALDNRDGCRRRRCPKKSPGRCDQSRITVAYSACPTTFPWSARVFRHGRTSGVVDVIRRLRTERERWEYDVHSETQRRVCSPSLPFPRDGAAFPPKPIFRVKKSRCNFVLFYDGDRESEAITMPAR